MASYTFLVAFPAEMLQDVELYKESVTAFDPYSLPRVFLGKASYLKAGLLEDVDGYVPGTILAILDLVGNYTRITEDFIAAVEAAFSLENTSAYSLGNEQEVLIFLFDHLGEYVMVT